MSNATKYPGCSVIYYIYMYNLDVVPNPTAANPGARFGFSRFYSSLTTR